MTFVFGPANLRKIAGEFLCEFQWQILSANVSAMFFQDFKPSKKFTPKIHAQKLSAFLSNFTFSTNFTFSNPNLSRRFSAYWGDQNMTKYHTQQIATCCFQRVQVSLSVCHSFLCFWVLPLHKRKEFCHLQGAFRGAFQKNDTCFPLFCCVCDL